MHASFGHWIGSAFGRIFFFLPAGPRHDLWCILELGVPVAWIEYSRLNDGHNAEDSALFWNERVVRCTVRPP